MQRERHETEVLQRLQPGKYWQSRVLLRDMLSRRITNLCNLSRIVGETKKMMMKFLVTHTNDFLFQAKLIKADGNDIVKSSNSKQLRYLIHQTHGGQN